MRRLAAAGLWCLIVAACASEAPTRVELAISAGTCEPADLGGMAAVSVELLGIDDQGRLCALGKRCLFDVGQLDSVDALVQVLQDANQPLIDVQDPDAHTVAVIGHDASCWGTDDHRLCGYADLGELDDGVLPMALKCGACADEEILFCP